MLPDKAVKQKESERERNGEAVGILIAEIQNDPDSTTREQKLASAIVALRDS